MIYLDHASTTPLRPEVRAAMEPFLGDDFGNPSSPHAAGRSARRALDDARESVAASLEGVDPRDVVFTSGATEANHLAILGTAAAHGRPLRLVTTAIEHPSVLAPAARLEARGWAVVRVPPDSRGRVDPGAVAAAAGPGTALVSVMAVNNEVGSVQDLAEIRARTPGVLLHSDAAQALGKVPFDARGLDLVTVSAHKLRGPKGAGALVARRGTPLEAQLGGGGQEFERRAGTENVAGAVGLAAALRLATAELPQASTLMRSLSDRLRAALGRIGGATINGPADRRAPHLVHVSFDGVDGQAAILALDGEGVCVSAGTACASGSLEPSPVLRAMGLPEALIRGSVRYSLAATTTEAEIDEAAAATARTVERLRR